MSPTQNNQNHINETSLGIWYQAILNRYNSTSNANNVIDNKSSVIFAIAAAIAVFGAERLAEHIGILGVLGLLGLIAAGVIVIVNTNLKKVSGEVNSTSDKSDYYLKVDHDFLLQMIADLEASLEELEKVNRKKAAMYKITTITFAAGSVILLLSVFWDFNLAMQFIPRS